MSVPLREHMGIFTVDLTVQHIVQRDRTLVIPNALVDSGSENTWVPATLLEQLGIGREKMDLMFQMANGTVLTRSLGFAIIRAGSFFCIDEVIFGEPDDMVILGSRSLEGMNVRIDAREKRLVAAGPILAVGARALRAA